MHLNSTHLIKHEGTELLEKQHVYEAELRDMVGRRKSMLVHDQSSRTASAIMSRMLTEMHFMRKYSWKGDIKDIENCIGCVCACAI